MYIYYNYKILIKKLNTIVQCNYKMHPIAPKNPSLIKMPFLILLPFKPALLVVCSLFKKAVHLHTFHAALLKGECNLVEKFQYFFMFITYVSMTVHVAEFILLSFLYS